eukprot:TRINITY_DN10154_c0_g1_i1.p1 TRINITY_DN10154_c0_g1~~TRINITY_DN10154_c0_g1_i1.p1  ORF type:complete len:102 (-),score=2.56 TRINITY_DN10154_c0_g1_i1:118-423(-)
MSVKTWSVELFNCCEDGEICALGFFCPCYQVYSNAEKLDEYGIFCGLLSCFIPCIPIWFLRHRARDRYKIMGSVTGDVVKSFCCPICASIQTANELDANNE